MDIVIRKKQWFISIMIFYWSVSVVFTKEKSQSDKDLTEAESSRSKLEIVKQIKKINDDGSYTIGYEADDGSFKIESRDVLGNIKGTYGFVDENGEIKRVTYSTKNESDTKYTAPTVVQRIPKTNRTYVSLLRKQEKQQPVTTTPSVIQSIPRRRFVFPTQSSTTSPKPTTSSTKEVNVVYAHSISKDQELKLERQLSKPAVEEIPSTETTLQKHTLETSLSEADSTIKPVTEEPEIHGNSLRRQLFQDRRPEFDTRQLTIQQSTDLSDIYTGSKTTGTPRPPLFTTTARSRSIPILSTTARALNATPFVIKHAQTTSSTRNQFVIPEYPQEQTTTESISSNEEFRTQVPVQGLPTPPYLQSHQRLAAIQHPSNGELILVPAGHPLLSQYTNNNNRPSGFISSNEERSDTQNHYQTQLRNGQNVQVFQPSPLIRAIPIDDNRITSEPNVIYGTLIPVNHRAPPLRVTHTEHELQMQIDEIEPPVSVNDFQKILDQLTIRQRKLEMVNSLVSSHIQDPLTRSSMILIPQRVPFQPIPYRQREYNPNIPIRTDQAYSQSKRMVVDRDGSEEKFLPPLVREMLLLKMLKLAINPYLPLEADTEAQYSATSNPTIIKTGGQRNVEILGEEVDETDDSRTYRRSSRSVLN
ncbi:uncharacterized protein LOC108742152 [Agrilus planipennis]|uniref:Uncharacterized protein LOC108742152 n=1 Tax=Agrilus planipennis TaxID=224129 RepID=A0A1W4X9K9_AGRPL|nr:uncharacterized protein LOC108742152 [Agrilus planipennis]